MLPCFCAAPGEVVSETQNGVENKISEGAKRKFRDLVILNHGDVII